MKSFSTIRPSSEFNKALELESVAAEELWRSTYSPVFLIDRECSIHYANTSCAEAFATDSNAFLGKSLFEFISDQHFPETLRGTLSVLERGDFPYVELKGNIISQNHEVVHCGVQIKITQTQAHPELFLVTLHYLAEGKEAHIGCVPAHVYLEKIIENVNGVLWLKSQKTKKIVYLSDNFESFFGIPKEEYLSNPQVFFDCIHPDDRELLIYKSNDEDIPLSETIGFRFKHRKGEWRNATAYRFLIENQFGAPDTIAGLTVDDTDHYQAQLEIEKQRETLAQQNQELYLANKNMEEFTHMAFHDLSMPLRVINTHIQILENKYIKNKDNESMSLIHSVYTNIYRMKSLIGSMINLPNFVKDKSRKLEFTCLRTLLEKKVNPLFMNALNPGLQIKNLRMTYIHAEEDHLITLFKNIIENGLKYNKNREKKITVNSRRFQGGAIVSVSDNGVGIPKGQQDEIFSFGKRGASAAAVAQGFGIGLAACKRIVELYNGKIWVRSKSGEGSTFYMFFPD